jgi:hypothetical protein
MRLQPSLSRETGRCNFSTTPHAFHRRGAPQRGNALRVTERRAPSGSPTTIPPREFLVGGGQTAREQGGIDNGLSVEDILEIRARCLTSVIPMPLAVCGRGLSMRLIIWSTRSVAAIQVFGPTSVCQGHHLALPGWICPPLRTVNVQMAPAEPRARREAVTVAGGLGTKSPCAHLHNRLLGLDRVPRTIFLPFKIRNSRGGAKGSALGPEAQAKLVLISSPTTKLPNC